MGIYWWRADHYCLNYHSLLSFVFLFKVAEHSFARALADAIQRAHKDCKNKHAVDTAIILFAQCPLYLCYFPRN